MSLGKYRDDSELKMYAQAVGGGGEFVAGYGKGHCRRCLA